MNISGGLKNVVSQIFDLKRIIGLLCLTGAAVAFLYFTALGFSSVYFPLRLYFTGSTTTCTIASAQAVMAGEDRWSEYVDYYVLECNAVEGQVVADRDYEDYLKVGNSIKIFYSTIIREGFVTTDQSVSPYDVFVDYAKYKPALVLIVVALLLIPVLLTSWSLTRSGFVQIANKQIASNNALQDPFKRKLIIAKVIVSYSVLIVFMYMLAGLMIKAVLTMEASYKLLAGLFMFGSLLLFLFLPYIVLNIRDGIDKNPVAENSLAILKILAGIYGCVKTFQFVQRDFRNYDNLKLVLEDFLMFLLSP